jgi:tetratricopeptide (TPR) repeat protein
VAEGLFKGILRDDSEPDAGAPPTSTPPTPPDAFATAMAAQLSSEDPGVARETAAYLRKQGRLATVQKRLMEDEHALRMKHLAQQWHLLRGQRATQAMRFIFQALTIIIAGFIGCGIVVLLYDAFTSRSAVIEPFDAPPDLAARGVTGKVVAAGLLGELDRLQGLTRTSAAKRELKNAWSNEVRLAVPEAGISLAELSRLLKNRFGHDLHIGGDLVESADGSLTLTVRGDGIQAQSFVGKSNELPQLTAKAAEYVYARSEPALYTAYLGNIGRDADAVVFARSAYATASDDDRPYILNGWAISLQNTGGSPQEALPLYEEALRLKPDFWIAYSNIENILWIEGREEDAWRQGEKMRRIAGGRPGRATERYYQNIDALAWNLPAWLASTNEDIKANGGTGSFVANGDTTLADIALRMHDPAAAELALSTTKADSNDPSIAAMTHFVHAGFALRAGDAARARKEIEAFETAFTNPAINSNYPGYNCWIAPIEEAAGEHARADAVLNSAGTFVDCYRFRGDILDARADWPGAQRAYAAAVKLAPDLPAGYYSWGMALVRHGDLAGAAEKLKMANEKGPHWADPLKASGDLLAKQGHRARALAKYDEALIYAPNWAELKEARERAQPTS